MDQRGGRGSVSLKQLRGAEGSPGFGLVVGQMLGNHIHLHTPFEKRQATL